MVKQAFDLICPAYPEFSPIIFLHGLTEYRRTWKNTAPAIARNTNRKVYLLDARNHGDSPRTDIMDLDSLADDVLEFMDDQRIRKAIVLGFSMGGKTALNFALKYPARLDKLIIEDVSVKNMRTGEDTLAWQLIEGMEFILKGLPPDLDEKSAKQMALEKGIMFFPSNSIINENFFKNYEPDMVPIRKVVDGLISTFDIEMAKKLLVSDPFDQNFPESGLTYDGDTLFLYGEVSPFKVNKDPSIKKLFPRAVLKKIERASHVTHVEFPQQFVEIVSNFILNSSIPESKY